MSVCDDLLKTYYPVKEGIFRVGGIPFEDLYRQYPTPFYVYDLDVVNRKLEMLRDALQDFEIYFAVKANPHGRLMEFFQERGCGLNVATAGEIAVAREHKIEPQRILLAGSGKSEEDFRAAVEYGVEEIHVDSFRELELLERICAETGNTVDAGLRFNPGSEQNTNGQGCTANPQAYGLDEEMLSEALKRARNCPHINLCSIHVYFGTQHLDLSYMARAYQHTISLAEQFAGLLDQPVKTVDFSGGFGVPYYRNEQEFPIAEFGMQIRPWIARLRQNPSFSKTRFVAEPGRYLPSEAGLYVVRILDKKISHGKTFLVTDGGIHHHLAATGNLGHVIRRNFPILIPSRLNEPAVEMVDIVGRQCTALDTLARNEKLPSVEPGEAIVFFQSGAYGLSASPTGFRSHPAAREIFVRGGHCRPS